jgi:predicted amino acid-binding ACT domain protein
MEKYTGLILVSSAITNMKSDEIESRFQQTLAPFSIQVLDTQRMQIRDRFFLAFYIKLDKAHQKAIEDDLQETADQLKVDLAIDYRLESD